MPQADQADQVESKGLNEKYQLAVRFEIRAKMKNWVTLLEIAFHNCSMMIAILSTGLDRKLSKESSKNDLKK